MRLLFKLLFIKSKLKKDFFGGAENTKDTKTKYVTPKMNFRIVNLIKQEKKKTCICDDKQKKEKVKRRMLTESLKLSLSEFTMDYTKLDLSAS